MHKATQISVEKKWNYLTNLNICSIPNAVDILGMRGPIYQCFIKYVWNLELLCHWIYCFLYTVYRPPVSYYYEIAILRRFRNFPQKPNPRFPPADDYKYVTNRGSFFFFYFHSNSSKCVSFYLRVFIPVANWNHLASHHFRIG